ncbi:UNVERIFIED_CONTAM: CPBP family intramembrane metalloprotease [Streptococcus canis]
MTNEIIESKKLSRYNLNWWIAPIVGFLLLLIGDILAKPFISALAFLGVEPKIAELFSFILSIIIFLLWARLVEQAPWKSLGFIKHNIIKQLSLGWVIGGGLLTICTLLMFLFGGIQFYGLDFSPKLLLRFIMIVFAWSIQGMAEEVVFRSWLLTTIAARTNIFVGVMVSSLGFMAAHLGNNGIKFIPLVDLFCFALLASLVFLRTKSIWIIGGFHAAWNCFQGSIFAFPVSGTNIGPSFIRVKAVGADVISGGNFGVEGSIITVLLQAILIGWLFCDFYYHNKVK